MEKVVKPLVELVRRFK